MPEAKKPYIIIAMPAYNEEKYIGSVVLGAKQYASEVIVVDDGSTDYTAKMARLAGAAVVNHGKNLGYGASIQTIMAEAARRDPDVLVIMDSDGQHKPDETPPLIKAILEGDDMVIGSRKLQRDRNTPLYRRIGQKVLLYLTNYLAEKKLTDTESGFRAFSRKAINTLKIKEGGMAISAETVIKASENGLRIREVAVSSIYTTDGSTLNPLQHGLQVLASLILIISATRLVFFFFIAGIIFIALGLLAFARALNIYYQLRAVAPGTAFASFLLIIIGVQSIFSGIVLKKLAAIKK